VDALLAMRAELNEGNRARISVTDLLIKAIARTHLFVPALNVNYLGDVIRHFTSVDISIAIATAHGLVTPVIRNAQVLSATEIAEASTSFAVRARSQQLRQHELEGGSITISNLGMRGVDEFAAIINPPQAAILAVGAAMQKPLVRNGKVIAATTMTMTLSVDHRAVDGAEAADWMATLSELLEHPVRILA
jgi:pyruvate dehydrogenase E2 component (dihydrolipoamide acetyltransferase)